MNHLQFRTFQILFLATEKVKWENNFLNLGHGTFTLINKVKLRGSVLGARRSEVLSCLNFLCVLTSLLYVHECLCMHVIYNVHSHWQCFAHSGQLALHPLLNIFCFKCQKDTQACPSCAETLL